MRQLFRRTRQILCRELAAQWRGSHSELKHAVTKFLKPFRRRWDVLLCVLRDTRRAALLAGAVLAGLLADGTQAIASPPVALSTVAAGTGGFVINGIDANDNSGWSVSNAGDVNGDGLADLIIGAYGSDPAGDSNAGESYVVFGKTSGTAVELSAVAAGTGGFVINGIDGDDQSGFSVSTAGDVNGDGLADLIVGARWADPGGDSYAGESYVVFGKTSGTAVELSAVAGGTGGFVINGIDDYDTSGSSVSAAGDVNGDGLADLIIGAQLADPGGDSDAGESYVVFGKTSGAAVELSAVATGTGGGFIINGIDGSDFSGRSVSAAGDVNGDGLSDLIIGAYKADPGGGNYAGESYVVFGKTNQTAVELSAVAAGTGGFIINGIDAGDFSGRCVSDAGDVNGDGLADLIVGADGANPGGDSGAGESYVVFGKNSGTAVELSDVAAGTGGFVINGFQPGDRSGWTVSSAEDVNGDGLADLMIGAYRAYSGVNLSAGKSYTVFGKTNGTAIELSDVAAGTGGFVLNGIDAYDYSGRSVSTAGDVNGDGLADLIIGAYKADPGGDSSAGESYVVFSPETAPLSPPSGVPASAAYKAYGRMGDGAGGAIVPVTEFPDGRVKIDFSDEDSADNGSGGASLTTVTLTRNKSNISTLGNGSQSAEIANVMWRVQTDRVNWTSGTLTLKYLDSEVTGITGGETQLQIFQAPAPSGPWIGLATTIDATRNEVRADITSGGYFAVANQVVPVELSKFKID